MFDERKLLLSGEKTLYRATDNRDTISRKLAEWEKDKKILSAGIDSEEGKVFSNKEISIICRCILINLESVNNELINILFHSGKRKDHFQRFQIEAFVESATAVQNIYFLKSLADYSLYAFVNILNFCVEKRYDDILFTLLKDSVCVRRNVIDGLGKIKFFSLLLRKLFSFEKGSGMSSDVVNFLDELTLIFESHRKFYTFWVNALFSASLSNTSLLEKMLQYTKQSKKHAEKNATWFLNFLTEGNGLSEESDPFVIFNELLTYPGVDKSIRDDLGLYLDQRWRVNKGFILLGISRPNFKEIHLLLENARREEVAYQSGEKKVTLHATNNESHVDVNGSDENTSAISYSFFVPEAEFGKIQKNITNLGEYKNTLYLNPQDKENIGQYLYNCIHYNDSRIDEFLEALFLEKWKINEIDNHIINKAISSAILCKNSVMIDVFCKICCPKLINRLLNEFMHKKINLPVLRLILRDISVYLKENIMKINLDKIFASLVGLINYLLEYYGNHPYKIIVLILEDIEWLFKNTQFYSHFFCEIFKQEAAFEGLLKISSASLFCKSNTPDTLMQLLFLFCINKESVNYYNSVLSCAKLLLSEPTLNLHSPSQKLTIYQEWETYKYRIKCGKNESEYHALFWTIKLMMQNRMESEGFQFSYASSFTHFKPGDNEKIPRKISTGEETTAWSAESHSSANPI